MVTWDGGASTLNWNDAANWSNNALPGAADDVVIDVPATAATIIHASVTDSILSLSMPGDDTLQLSGGSLTIAAASALNAGLTIEHGTLTANGTVTLSGSSTWSGGTIDGAGGVTNTGTVTVSAGGMPTLGASGTLVNQGTLVIGTNSLRFVTGATISNPSGGLVRFDGDNDFVWSAGARRRCSRTRGRSARRRARPRR